MLNIFPRVARVIDIPKSPDTPQEPCAIDLLEANKTLSPTRTPQLELSRPQPVAIPTQAMTARFEAWGERTLNAEQVACLRHKVVVIVRGFMAEIYSVVGNGYFDAHADFCNNTAGTRVLLGAVGQFYNSSHNARILYEQLARLTTPEDSIILFAHSNGTQATLRLLLTPEYADIGARIHGWVPVNGVFGGSPLATLVGTLVGNAAGKMVQFVGGDVDVVEDMTPASRQEFLRHNAPQIDETLKRISVVPIVSTFRGPRSLCHLSSMIMLAPYLYMRWWCGMENDGAVPEANQLLPSHEAVKLEDMNHADTVDQTGPWDLHEVTRRVLGMIIEDMPEELRELGRPRSSSWPHDCAPGPKTFAETVVEQDAVTKLLRTYQHARLALSGGVEKSTDLQRASKLLGQAMHGYKIASLAGIAGVGSLPLLFTGLPAVLLSASVLSAQCSGFWALQGAYCGIRGLLKECLDVPTTYELKPRIVVLS